MSIRHMFKKLLPIFVFTLFFGVNIILPSWLMASSNQNNEYILPRDVTRRVSDLGKVYEKIGLFVKFRPGTKLKYWRNLLDNRLMEMKFVAEEKGLGVFEETSSRYATYVGNYSEYMISNKLSEQKDKTNQMFNKHLEVLTPLLYKYDYNSAWWLLLQQDIDTINIFQKRINKEL